MNDTNDEITVIAKLANQRDEPPTQYQAHKAREGSGHAPPADDCPQDPSRVEADNRLSCSISDFLAVPLPPRECLMTPWLHRAGAAMIHAWRGVGKTHVAVGVAVACASGGEFLRWRAPKPVRVLYIDGEMPAQTMQERFKAAVATSPSIPSGDYLRLITPDNLPAYITMPNLLTTQGQQAIEPDLEGCDLVVFDNVATIFRTDGDQNAAGGWLDAQTYILTLRRRGIASLVIDHDNKTGGNRGTSAKQDIMETVMHLSWPKGYRESEGARFNVEFTKNRGFFGRDAAPFEARLIETISGPSWTIADADDILQTRVEEMLRDGVPERDIRSNLGIGGSKVSRIKKNIQNRGSENGA